MKLNDIINKPFRKTKLEIRNLITRIKSFIKRIIVAHQDVMTPFSRDLAEKTVETVHTLRTLSPDEISVVLTKLVDTKSKPAETLVYLNIVLSIIREKLHSSNICHILSITLVTNFVKSLWGTACRSSFFGEVWN